MVGIIDKSGNLLVSYTYDAWGNILSVTGSKAATLGYMNPLTYRGYVYDWETGLYYLESRYYNPEWGRFINADSIVATGQGILGNNMFAYCRNNPVCRKDISGTTDVEIFDDDSNLLDEEKSYEGGQMNNGGPGETKVGGDSGGNGGSSGGNGSPTQNADGLKSNPHPDKMRTPDQQALYDLAKGIKQNACQGKFISYDEAKLLDGWAEEYGVYQHHGAIIGSGSHWVTGWDHTHIYNIHVPFATNF